jgi:RNA polymerase sigma factor (sigma-70 family)
MANGSLSAVLQYLRRLQRGPGSTADVGDARLLERYTALGDEAAFAALVRRHGPMVWGVCTRLLHHTQDAEDAFQATFLVLVRKARSLHGPDRLPPWLYGVAYRTALKARAEAARRKARESMAVEKRAGKEPAEAVWDDLRSVLDEEVNRLPRRYRTPFLLCYLEGMSNDEAARRLGCPKGTVCSRLSRAREILRKRLGRRGVSLSGAALATVLSEHAAPAAVPLALAEATIALGFGAASGVTAGTLSTHAAVLAEGVLHGMFLTKLKLAVVIVLALGIVGSGAGFLTHHPAGKQAQAAAPPQAGPAPPAVAAKKEERPEKEAPKDTEPIGPHAKSREMELRPSKALATPVKFPGFDDPKTTLVEALDSLAKRYDITFDVNEKAFKAEQVNEVILTEIAQPHPIPEMQARLGRILKKILDRIPNPSGATFLIRKDLIEITTQAAVRDELGIKGEGPLPPLVSEEFEEEPLKLALRRVSDSTESNIVLNLRPADKAQTLVTARLMNVPVETAVRILADMAGLQVVRLDNVLYVTTPEHAARLQIQQNEQPKKTASRAP